MSREILKALMQLFAIIAKQDAGLSGKEQQYIENLLTRLLNKQSVDEYLTLFNDFVNKGSKRKLTSVGDSVRILGIAKKINKTLTQHQKIIVIVRLFEFLNTEKNITDQRLAIINTVSEVFNIPVEEFNNIRGFIFSPKTCIEKDNFNVLAIVPSETNEANSFQKEIKSLSTNTIFFLRTKSINSYFIHYQGTEEIYLNGLTIFPDNIYLFANGSTLKPSIGKPIYYSDLVAHFISSENETHPITLEAKNLTYKFKTGDTGLHPISFSATNGNLVGVMGASGSGKTTLLNILSGNYTPTDGEVLINNLNYHTERNGSLKGIVGLVPQDDLLIEELTVFENLFFNAKLCLSNLSDNAIKQRVIKQLDELGLLEIKNLKVGSPLNKYISGGQRKRLNIALELIREPEILYLDEPTSGLSSRDSENVMNLLRELSFRGKLVFVVIHQPSSDIFKMFDNILILDSGGYLIFSGNPIDSIVYFKTADNQLNSHVGECPTCGNVNPELIFNIIDAKIVDEFGRYTKARKRTPIEWYERFKEQPLQETTLKEVSSDSKFDVHLHIPTRIQQLKIYFTRDFLSKFANRQYMILNLIEAPLLALILSVTIYYIADPSTNTYIFRQNENIPIYIFMSIIVSLFLGLSISADEIFKDRKLLEREKFLNLSRSGYLISKISILFGFSAIQSLFFVLIGNSILGIHGMYFPYWLAIFSIGAFSNILGLIISSSFNSVVTIYILIPLIMIPQMILGGAMFNFNKLNRLFTRPDKVPILADITATRWAYEALLVNQFKNNEFEKHFYQIEKEESYYNFKQVYYLPKLNDKLDFLLSHLSEKDTSFKVKNTILLLKHELSLLHKDNKLQDSSFPQFSQWINDSISEDLIYSTKEYLLNINKYCSQQFLIATSQKEKLLDFLLSTQKEKYNYLRNNYDNESIDDLVQKVFEKNKIIEYNHTLAQNVDPIYQDPIVEGYFDYRAQFYAPVKHFAGHFFDTFYFNILAIWLMSIFAYIILYFNLLKKTLSLFT